MKLIYLSSLLVLFALSNLFAQERLENDIDMAYQNAKKGIYWAISNIPEKKSKLENDLISEDRLYASVRLYKEVKGVKVVSKGFFQTNEVEIKVYKSYDSLISEGYNVPTNEKEE
ncbi:MAG: hypothetical protein KJN64_09135 [Ignavibacteria bacterium]|nr:hypothetical protein [Ignavibacteria bacterium]MBT8381861.1 hypothetical protein [Ignavibacteria bacterium]MBT8393203.1 hypothetical protein [Ignavibacteria bacterium]NNJ52383.1 hypothetical protein [Ignavibacteriaceae bacterium]NNL21825.1 hypothetical protein [Ignavibacteriaceae bacterium]